MVSPSDCLKKYGLPNIKNSYMTLWDVPTELEIGVIPKRIYCNKDLIPCATLAFKNLIDRGLVSELKTWDGCFNVRMQRGSSTTFSLHSWGIAIDINAFENQLNVQPKLSPDFVQCFKDAGFNWGGDFKRWDGMHFELASI